MNFFNIFSLPVTTTAVITKSAEAYNIYKTCKTASTISSIATGGAAIPILATTLAVHYIYEPVVRKVVIEPLVNLFSAKPTQYRKKTYDERRDAESSSTCYEEQKSSNTNSGNKATTSQTSSGGDRDREDEDDRKKKIIRNGEPKDVCKHLRDRLLRYIRFMGYLQKVSERTNIPREKIIRMDKAGYHDISSTNNEYQAGHVIRLNDINDVIISNPKYIDIYKILINFGAHTQFIEKYANKYRKGLGGAIDNLQTSFLDIFNDIDFRGEMNEEARNLLERFRNEFLNIIKEFIENGKSKYKLSDDQVAKLKESLKELSNLTADDLYEEIQKGYKGEVFDPYK